ncbi:MAG: SPOR domain-containing protein [Pseudomonadota bacterium]
MADREPRMAPGGAGADFFAGGARGFHLDQLRHLSQWSRRILLVTGPRGAGKTVLYQQLSASLEPRAKAARIDASLIEGATGLLGAVLHGFGLASPADDALLEQTIIDHARAQEEADRFCIVLIDDAERLGGRALEQLLALSRRSPLRLVLFGEERLAGAVARAARREQVEWHEIRLAGLNVDEVQLFLEWRFNGGHAEDGLPFSDAQIRELTRLSHGLPGRVEHMAEALLARIDAGGESGVRRRLPVRHLAVAAALALAVGLVYLVPEPAADRVERIEVPPVAEAAGVDAKPEAEAARPPPTLAPRLTQPAPAVYGTDEPEPAEPEPAEPEPAEVERAEAEPTAAATAGAPRGARWIMRQPASSYTLQLISVSSADRAAEYVAAQPDPEHLAVYRLQRDGRILHVVVYGAFASRSDAEAASRNLPGSVGDVHPWIRTFGDVQQGVRTALQE